MSNYDAYQQVFVLSLISNRMQRHKGTQTALQAAFQRKLPALLGMLDQWQVAWGPVVWKHDPDNTQTGPDHVWFVARHPNLKISDSQLQETYVTAIAATSTAYNWTDNNVRINQVVDFSQWIASGLVAPPHPVDSPSPQGCYISLGTALGAHRLATVAPPRTAAGGNIPLLGFWTNFPPSPNTRVILTGHSLGAGLSAVLALGLLESGAFRQFLQDNILVYPTAGPTPGNLKFVQLFAAKFPRIARPQARYEVWNCNLVNLLDIVSQAWCTSQRASPLQNMDNIPPIYGRPTLFEVEAVVGSGKIAASSSGIIYMPMQANRFRGPPPQSTPNNIDKFLELALRHHVNEFLRLFKVGLPMIFSGSEDGVVEMTVEEAYATEPILGEIVLRASRESGEESIVTVDADDRGDSVEGYGVIELQCGDFDTEA